MPLRLPSNVPGYSLLNGWAREIEGRLARAGSRIDNAHHVATTAHALATGANPVQSGAVAQVTTSGNFGYSATTTSITWFWDGTNSSNPFVLHTGDGNQIAVPKGSLQCTGLTATTTYKFYPYYSVGAAEMVFALGGVGTPAIAFTSPSATAAASQILNGNLTVASGSISAATTTSGGNGGTGGGGSGCLAPWAIVLTKADGEKPISECEVGEWIFCPWGWTQIQFLEKKTANKLCVVRVEGGLELPCTETHPLAMPDMKWVAPPYAMGCELITVEGPRKVVEVRVEDRSFTCFHPGCQPYHEFWSNGILTHNVIFIK